MKRRRKEPQLVPLLVPRLKESVRLPGAEFSDPEGHRLVRELAAEIAQAANEFRESYFAGAQQILDALLPRSLETLAREEPTHEERASLLTAASFGLAAGQLEAAHGTDLPDDKTHPIMHSALAVSAPEFGVLGAYLMWVGHYIGRRGGEGLDRAKAMLDADAG